MVGLLIGEAEFKLDSATLGTNNPFELEDISSCEELAGLVVAIPTCENELLTSKKDIKRFMNFNFINIRVGKVVKNYKINT